MGLFSKSSKKTKNITENYLFDDDITATMYGDMDAGGGSIVDLDGIKESTITVNSTDHGTVAKTLQLLDDQQDAGYEFVGKAYDSGVGFLTEANQNTIGALKDAHDDSLEYVTGAHKEAMYFVGSALSLLDKSTDDTATAIQTNAQQAMRFLSENARSEQDLLFDKATSFGKWVLIAAGVLGVGLFVFAKKG